MGTNNPDGTPNTAYPRLHNKDALDYSEDEKDEDKIHQGFDYQQGLESKASEGDMEDNEDQVAMADGQADLEDDWDSIDDAFKTDAQIAEDKQRRGESKASEYEDGAYCKKCLASGNHRDKCDCDKSDESDTSNYEVDVDEYLKTGDPVQKTGRGRSDLDNQERITGEKHVKDWHGNTADVDDDNNITNRKSYREAYDYDGNEISGLQEQAIKWWNWQDAKHDSFIPPQGEYPEGTSFEQEEEIHKGMLNVIGSATSPMSGEGLEADELDRLVSYLVGKGLITDNSFIASEADDSIVRTTREGPNMFEDIENPDFAWKGDDGETTSKEADNYQQKPHMTDNEWEKDLSDIKNRYQTETKDVSYDEDYEINIQGKDKELEDIPALEGINYGYESYESYPTKKSRVGKTKASEVYDGIVDDYEKFQVL